MRGLPALAAAVLVLLAGCASSPSPSVPGPVERGRALFESPKAECASCHTVGGGRLVGPDLAGVADRSGQRVPNQSAEEYLRTSILDPGAYVVPGFSDAMARNLGNRLTPAEVDDLVAYLMTLHAGASASPQAAGTAQLLLPNSSLLADYYVAGALVGDPTPWSQALGVRADRYENLQYKTTNETYFVHIEGLRFPDAETARRAYAAFPAYLDTYTTCQGERHLSVTPENFFCDNTGLPSSEILLFVAPVGSWLLIAHTHDPVTPGSDLMAYLGKTLQRMGP